jgi:hypothetical protein
VARDSGSDEKSSKKRWGRGKSEEGPSDEDLGWLADLRGARDTRAPLGLDEPTGPVGRRGRRGATAEPPAPPPPPPAAPPADTRRGRKSGKVPPVVPAPDVAPAPPSGRRGRRAEPPPPVPPVVAPPPVPPPPPPPPPVAPPTATGAPSTTRRTGLRRTPSVPPPAVPPVPPVPPAPSRGRAGRSAEPGAWEGLTADVPRVGEDTATRAGRPRRDAGPPPPAGPPAPPLGGPPMGGPPLVGPPLGGPPLGGPPLVGPPPTPPLVGPPPAGSTRPGSGPAPADLLVTTGMIKRAEIRRQLRVAQQLKVATLVVVAMLLLLAYPIYELTKAGVKDPVLGQLDSLNLPGWADMRHDDATAGSRWCINQCRFRQRTWESERKPDLAYDTALREAGWRPRTDGICPAVQEGTATCWKYDEFVMDMWVREPVCDVPPPRASASPRPSASPGPSGQAAPSAPTCPGSLVTMKIFNAVDYQPVL